MEALYHSPLIEDGFQGSLNPGGPELTRHLIACMALPETAMVLDIGCGKGQGLEILQQGGRKCIGVDTDPHFAHYCTENGHRALCASMEALPFKDGSIDTIICQCAWNLSDKQKSLSEFQRVLVPQGRLGITDIFLHQPQHKEPWPISTCLNGAEGFYSPLAQLAATGFKVHHHQDHSKLFKQRMAEMVFRHGSLEKFWQKVSGSPEKGRRAYTLGKATRPGLFLITAQKQ